MAIIIIIHDCFVKRFRVRKLTATKPKAITEMNCHKKNGIHCKEKSDIFGFIVIVYCIVYYTVYTINSLTLFLKKSIGK